MYKKNMFDCYFCIKSFCHLKTLEKCFFVFVCFCCLSPMSTAMVIAGRSVHLTTLFPGQA